MKSSRILRSALLLSALGAALNAQAFSIFINSHGFYTPTGITGFSLAETVDFQDGGFSPFTTLTVNAVFGVSTVTGTGTYTSGADTLNFNFTYNLEDVTFDIPASSSSVAGKWTYTSGTGNYVNLTGSGTLAFNAIDYPNFTRSGTLFSGTLNAVPEPASMAALAVGATAMLRRRRKA